MLNSFALQGVQQMSRYRKLLAKISIARSAVDSDLHFANQL